MLLARAKILSVLTMLVFIACWTLQVCAGSAASAASGDEVHPHRAQHEARASVVDAADGETSQHHCDSMSVCAAPATLTAELDAKAFTPPEAPVVHRPAPLRGVPASRAPTLSAPAPPTPVQTYAVQLN